MDEKKRIIVGLNEFVVPEEEEVPIRIRMDRTIEEQMTTAETLKKRIEKLKAKRDQKMVKDAMERLKSEAGKGERHNLIPAIKDALRTDATFGEILGVLRVANGYSYDPYKMIENPFV
ncbi:MAG: methylmalonyl-CoA mutase family protein [Syntrophales bacterium]|nr:methylmalonyl-CoA mutase family protein [Syntrophales bacterium]